MGEYSAAPAAVLSGKLPGRCALRVSGKGRGRTPHALRTVAARPLRAGLDSQAHSARPAAHLVPIDLEDERRELEGRGQHQNCTCVRTLLRACGRGQLPHARWERGPVEEGRVMYEGGGAQWRRGGGGGAYAR